MLTTEMLTTMCDRGPDSAGFAVYGVPSNGKTKITVQSATPEKDFADLGAAISKAIGTDARLQVKATHAVLTVPT